MDDNTTIPEGTPAETGGSDLDIINEVLEEKNHSQPTDMNTSAEVKEDSSEGETETTPPSTQEETPVVDSINETTKEATESAPAQQFDPDLDTWAEKRGLSKLSTDLERKLAQDIRNQQREFSSKQEADKRAAEIAQAIEESAKEFNPEPEVKIEESDPDDYESPEMREIRQLRAERELEKQERSREVYLNSSNASEAEVKEMGEILKEFAAQKDKASHDYFTSHTDKWHALAKARLASQVDNTELEQRAAQKERERLANIQKAQTPDMSATSTVTTPQGEISEDREIILAGLK